MSYDKDSYHGMYSAGKHSYIRRFPPQSTGYLFTPCPAARMCIYHQRPWRISSSSRIVLSSIAYRAPAIVASYAKEIKGT